MKIFAKLRKQKICSHPSLEWSEGGGGSGWYSPGASSTLTQIVPYLSSFHIVFHSVIYNSVCIQYILKTKRPIRTNVSYTLLYSSFVYDSIITILKLLCWYFKYFVLLTCRSWFGHTSQRFPSRSTHCGERNWTIIFCSTGRYC